MLGEFANAQPGLQDRAVDGRTNGVQIHLYQGAGELSFSFLRLGNKRGFVRLGEIISKPALGRFLFGNRLCRHQPCGAFEFGRCLNEFDAGYCNLRLQRFDGSTADDDFRLGVAVIKNEERISRLHFIARLYPHIADHTADLRSDADDLVSPGSTKP